MLYITFKQKYKLQHTPFFMYSYTIRHKYIFLSFKTLYSLVIFVHFSSLQIRLSTFMYYRIYTIFVSLTATITFASPNFFVIKKQESDNTGDYSIFECTFSCLVWRINPQTNLDESVNIENGKITSWFKKQNPYLGCMSDTLKIAIIGDYNFTYNAHHATNLSLDHSADFLELEPNYYWIKIGTPNDIIQLRSRQYQCRWRIKCGSVQTTPISSQTALYNVDSWSCFESGVIHRRRHSRTHRTPERC